MSRLSEGSWSPNLGGPEVRLSPASTDLLLIVEVPGGFLVCEPSWFHQRFHRPEDQKVYDEADNGPDSYHLFRRPGNGPAAPLRSCSYLGPGYVFADIHNTPVVCKLLENVK